jgi:hypothetical protein
MRGACQQSSVHSLDDCIYNTTRGVASRAICMNKISRIAWMVPIEFFRVGEVPFKGVDLV